MGLDMWMYKIGRLTDKEVDVLKGKTEAEISDMGYGCINYTSVLQYNEEDLFEDMFEYGTIIDGKVNIFNEDRFKEDHGIDKNAYRCFGSYGNEIVFSYVLENTKETKEIKITEKEWEKYIETEPALLLVYKKEEIGYWRKEYGLQNLIYTMYENETSKIIMNCGYHLMTKEMIDRIRKYDPKFRTGRRKRGEAYFYHEWY
jgi:hypothetical protein